MRLHHYAMLLFVPALLSRLAVADTLVMKDGRRLEGTIVEEDADTVSFRIKSAVVKIKVEEIEQIIRGGPVEAPKEESDAALRRDRVAAVGHARLDPLRAEAGKALDSVAEKRKALTAAAKKIDSQTNAYTAQLRKVQASDAILRKSKERLTDAEAKFKAAEDRLKVAKDQTGREPGPLKQEVQDASAKFESVKATVALAQRALDDEKKKLDDETDRFQRAAESLRPSVAKLSEAYDALDAAWAALAGEEKRQAEDAPWWPAPAEAARVRLEGRVVSCEKGTLILKVGAEADPGQWSEEVTIAAPGFETAKGRTLLLVARRDKAGWVLEEAR
ncbi:MAG: hypothetical protein FD180_4583 [Planctomycetota bacterium]|nr:MAG: hypothetical protein FD180_4583 [Planctomycetota bacterium]